MSVIAQFDMNATPKKLVKLLLSADTGEYVTDPNTTKQNLQSVAKADVLINPDLTAVKDVPQKYWKRVNDTVVEMSVAEKQAITDAEVQARKANADSFSVSMTEVITALIKVINLRLPAGQKITKQEMIDAVKAEIT